MSKYTTLVIYKSGRRETLFHKNEPDMKKKRGLLAAMETVEVFWTPKTEDLR